MAKGGFFNSKSGCVLYADATYTRVYTVVDGFVIREDLRSPTESDTVCGDKDLVAVGDCTGDLGIGIG